MRIQLRFSLATFLLLPVLAGVGIKLYRGPHQYTLKEEREWLRAEDEKDGFVAMCGGFQMFEEGTFWAYRNLDGSFTRHGPETKVGMFGIKSLVEYRNGKKHGECRAWDRDGELRQKGQYENDEPAGEWLYYSDGVVYQRVRHEREQGQEIESTYELGRLTQRRVTTTATGEISLTAWHPNGRMRLKGGYIGNLPQGRWRWCDEEECETRTVTFQDGVPAELAGQPSAARMMELALDAEFSDLPLQDAVDYLNDLGFPTRIECAPELTSEIRSRLITTPTDLRGPAGIYLALREVGLTLDLKGNRDGTDLLVVSPASGTSNVSRETLSSP
jgi:hypothetical protein